MKMNMGFIVIVEDAKPEKHNSLIETPRLNIHITCVSNYTQAVKVAELMVQKGITLLDLCGGFGHKGVAMVAQAVRGKANVAVARDDKPLVLKGKSGDDVFDK